MIIPYFVYAAGLCIYQVIPNLLWERDNLFYLYSVKDFIIQIEPGKYKGRIIQEGSFTKELEINVSKTSTNIGTINLEPIDYNTLIIMEK